MLEKIENIIDIDVRPQLLDHEGDIKIISFEDGNLRIKLTGHCAGCPSAQITTEELVATSIQRKVPEVKQVILINEVSQDLLDFAHQLINK